MHLHNRVGTLASMYYIAMLHIIILKRTIYSNRTVRNRTIIIALIE